MFTDSVEATNHKDPQESPVVRPRTPSFVASEPHPPAGEHVHTESAHIEASDTPHVDVVVDTASGPLSVTHPPCDDDPYTSSPLSIIVPPVFVYEVEHEEGVVPPFFLRALPVADSLPPLTLSGL